VGAEYTQRSLANSERFLETGSQRHDLDMRWVDAVGMPVMMRAASFTSVHRGGHRTNTSKISKTSSMVGPLSSFCSFFSFSSIPKRLQKVLKLQDPVIITADPTQCNHHNQQPPELTRTRLSSYLPLASSSFLTPSSLRLPCPTVESSLEIVDVCVRCTYYPFNNQLELEYLSRRLVPLFEIPTSNPSAQVTVPINNTTTLYSSITHLTHCTHCTRNVR
jgi:hypothetical protein